jgi:rhomboid protease GluP
MHTTPTVLLTQEHIYASKKSTLNITRLSLWGGAVIGIAITATTSKNGFSWFSTLFLLGFVGLLDWFFRRQMRSGKVYASLDDSGIASEAFGGEVKRFEWKDVSEIALTRVQNYPVLQLVLKASTEHPDKRNFLTGHNAARPSLALAALDLMTQEKLFQSIQMRVRSSSLGNDLPKMENQLTHENEFQEKLKSFAPIPWLTYGLIAINVAIWLATLGYGAGVGASSPDLLLLWGGNAASEVQRGEWWRMVSAIFLHNGLMHVALNMVGLYSVGMTVERIYGHKLFALIYFGSGLFGSALSLHFSAQKAVSVGASGAVFGVTGALLIAMLQHRKQLPKTMSKQTLGSLGFFIFYALAQGLSKPGIDNAAHIGGLLAGCLLAYLLPERFDMENFVSKYKTRAFAGVLLALGATAGLASIAPTAQVDQRGGLQFARGMQKFSAAVQAVQREAALVKSGEISELDSDNRSRTVFAPMMRDVVADLGKVQLPSSDPRNAVLVGSQKLAVLLLESLAMESVVREGSSKPVPANPVRMAEIEKETQTTSDHLVALQRVIATQKKP